LGVIRAGEVALGGGSWQSHFMSVPGMGNQRLSSYEDLRVVSGELIIAQFGSDSDGNRTDIRLACDGLPLKMDGTVVPGDQSWSDGHYGFCSGISSSGRLAVVDRWARLLGIPIFITQLLKVNHDGNGSPTGVSFEAVVPNPTALADAETGRPR